MYLGIIKIKHFSGFKYNLIFEYLNYFYYIDITFYILLHFITSKKIFRLSLHLSVFLNINH